MVTTERLKALEGMALAARADILTMTTLAGSGHPGGSLSSLEMLLAVLEVSGLRPEQDAEFYRDHLVVSHGHISPGVYSALSQYGFMDAFEVVSTFRKAGSPYEGHVERSLPGVDWTTGNLGQGLSAACGMALALRKGGYPQHRVYCLQGDGEQAKGQIAEARRFAVAYGLENLVTLIDWNGLQISGQTTEVFPVDIAKEYASAGWTVLEVDGHNLSQLIQALDKAKEAKAPVCIMAKTIMGKGVSFIEDDEAYHGKALTEAELVRALQELGVPRDLAPYKKRRESFTPSCAHNPQLPQTRLNPGKRRVYPGDASTDMRSAWGQALVDLAEVNGPDPQILVFDCDLAGSVKTQDFAKKFPHRFIQAGIQEHMTATLAGAASLSDQLVFWADFGVFAVDEVFNQQRLNSLNRANLKTVCTHCGIDVGEDGPTHQTIETIPLLRSIPGVQVLMPSDPNQTDAMARYMATEPGSMVLLMGRSKVPVLTKPDGEPVFGSEYQFRPGSWDLVRPGKDGLILSWGVMTHRAVEAADRLAQEGKSIGVIAVGSLEPPKPSDLQSLTQVPWVITIEDQLADVGMGAWLTLHCYQNRIHTPIHRMGPRDFPCSGASEEVFALLGLDTEGLIRTIQSL